MQERKIHTSHINKSTLISLEFDGFICNVLVNNYIPSMKYKEEGS